MEFKTSKLLEIRVGLTSFKKKELKGALSFRLARAFKPLMEACSSFDEVQAEVLKRHATPSKTKANEFEFVDEDGKHDKAKYEAYQAEMKELLDAKVEVNTDTKIPQADFDALDVTVEEAEALSNFTV